MKRFLFQELYYSANQTEADVQGQQRARRALEVAAAGGHNLLFSGSPGTGKTMLASRLPGILPPMTHSEALELAAIASVSQSGRPQIDGNRQYKTGSVTSSLLSNH